MKTNEKKPVSIEKETSTPVSTKKETECKCGDACICDECLDEYVADCLIEDDIENLYGDLWELEDEVDELADTQADFIDHFNEQIETYNEFVDSVEEWKTGVEDCLDLSAKTMRGLLTIQEEEIKDKNKTYFIAMVGAVLGVLSFIGVATIAIVMNGNF